ncbi:ABC transporter ATP-binding protein [Nitratireductor aquibiodomus]|uniref:ABC transporter ATP-binding protein n=1 Tax=Nitratireductor aquibiodomus TaxID=204799 RepID=UPI00046870C4|nr:ABC transporter ATP-binding protein [Nitratireductor aquibiodomus]
MLKVENLVKKFGGVTALDGISLTLPDRSILGVLGMNGSGKTTMLNCINGLYDATAGEITLDGVSLIGKVPHAVFSEGVGRTFQVPRIFPQMSLLENLSVALLNKGLSNAEIAKISAYWLKKVELYRLRHNYAEELSGGQQKLLELARIMVANPKLVLLDEPFAGVNPSLALLLINIIREMPKELGCSVLLVSHDLTSVYELSDNILVMHEGRVLAEGDAEAIQKNPDVIEAYLGA